MVVRRYSGIELVGLTFFLKAKLTVHWLIISSVIWGLSFGLIKKINLPIAPATLGVWRIALASVVGICVALVTRARPNLRLAKVGFIQLGAMYAPYLASFRYLAGHEVALWTMTTPLYVALLDMRLRRVFSPSLAWVVLLVICGGFVLAIRPDAVDYHVQPQGIILVQLSNLLFAMGQHNLRRLQLSPKDIVQQSFGYFFGALLGALLWSALSGQYSELTNVNLTVEQFSAVLGLGILSTGVGFILWNVGASQVSIHGLTIMSDLKLPIAVLLAVLVFGETPRYLQVSVAMAFFAAATFVARRVDSSPMR